MQIWWNSPTLYDSNPLKDKVFKKSILFSKLVRLKLREIYSIEKLEFNELFKKVNK